jgi:hypothetical protein
MQLMPNTFAELQKTYGLGPDRFDPQTNIDAGTAYIGQLYKQFGNWGDALAAYNAGPNRWAQVKAGTREAPRETQAYVPKVLAGFGQPQTPQEAAVPLFGSARSPSLTGLLEVDQDKNWQDGLGGLLNFGQTESQSPRTDPAAMPGTTQTDRLDVSGKINELLADYLKQPQQSVSPLQYALGGASAALQPLAGDEAQRQQTGSELDKLLKVGAYGNQQRTAELNEANSIIDNRYKQALTTKALTPDRDAKVVGKGVYVNGKWEAAPWANGSDSGPLDGTGIDAQMTNVYVTLSQKQASGQPLTPQETQMLALSERHLNKPRLVTGPDGVVREVAPEPLPQAGGPPSLLGAPQATPAPAPSRVTEVVPANVKPTNEQNLNAGFANRLNTASTIFDTLETKGYAVPSKYDTTVGQLPGVGNYMTSDQYKSLEQAQREFINAQLRRESGAAISPSEFDNANKQYFPQPGDSADVIAQKRRSRELAVRNMAQSAGPAKLEFTPRKVDDKQEGGNVPAPPPGFTVR